MATIRDVAARAGVSVSTVSIVLNGQEAARNIPPGTAERVRSAMEALQYRPSRAARALRGKQGPPTFALCWVLDGRSAFFMRIARGVAAAASENPFDFLVLPYENGKLPQIFPRLRADGFQGILIGCTTAEDQRALESMDFGKPAVLLNRDSRCMPCCTTDVGEIGRIAAARAVALGATRLGIVTARDAREPKTTRRDEVLRACAAAGILCPEDAWLRAENGIAGGYDAAQRLLALPRLPEVVFCDNEVLAAGVSAGLRAGGTLRVRLLAAGLGLPELGRHMRPAVELIDIPGEEIGLRGARMLSDLVRGGEAETRQLCPCRLIPA